LIDVKSIATALPAAALVFCGTIALGAAEIRPNGRDGMPVGILVLDDDPAAALRVIAAADGRLVATGGWLRTVITRSDDPDFVAKLYRAGASLVFRADGAVGCGSAVQTSNNQRES
jgi:hypothetical protein